MAGFIPLGHKAKKDLTGSVGSSKKALQLVKVSKVHLTSLPSDWLPCLGRPYPPLAPLPPLHNSLPRCSQALFSDLPPFLVPPDFLLHPGGNHKHKTGLFNSFST